MDIQKNIFRAYDIRGIVGEGITEKNIILIGTAIGTRIRAENSKQVIVARDGRLSGPFLHKALLTGLLQSGCEIYDVGCVPTPLLYFATKHLQIGSAIMLTGSHNPAEYNGLKVMINNKTLYNEKILDLYNIIQNETFITGEGSLATKEIMPVYIEAIKANISLKKPLKIVIDCGNGVTGIIAPHLFAQLGCAVVPLYCEVDGNFPNHHPDPSKMENLRDLQTAVLAHKADIGFAFDGDGDRVGVVDNTGKVIWADKILMLLAQAVLVSNPHAEIIYDVKSSKHIEPFILAAGGKPLMWKTGHSFIKAKMQETGALLAGEFSGHFFIKDKWNGFDDGLYAAARLLEILAHSDMSSNELFATLPESMSTEELQITVGEEEKFYIIEKLKAHASFVNAEKILIDGLRVVWPEGWGLIRSSNTTPSIVLRFEADNIDALQGIIYLFQEALFSIDPHLKIPYFSWK